MPKKEMISLNACKKELVADSPEIAKAFRQDDDCRDFHRKVGLQLKSCRKAGRISRKMLAKRSGLSKSVIIGMERGTIDVTLLMLFYYMLPCGRTPVLFGGLKK